MHAKLDFELMYVEFSWLRLFLKQSYLQRCEAGAELLTFPLFSAVMLIPGMYNSGCVLQIILDSWENWSFGLMLVILDDELLNHQND